MSGSKPLNGFSWRVVGQGIAVVVVAAAVLGVWNMSQRISALELTLLENRSNLTKRLDQIDMQMQNVVSGNYAISIRATILETLIQENTKQINENRMEFRRRTEALEDRLRRLEQTIRPAQ